MQMVAKQKPAANKAKPAPAANKTATPAKKMAPKSSGKKK
jgi:hypothetical protein